MVPRDSRNNPTTGAPMSIVPDFVTQICMHVAAHLKVLIVQGLFSLFLPRARMARHCTATTAHTQPPAHSICYLQGPRLPPRHEARYMSAFEELMMRWKDSDVEFFVPQLAAVLMSKGVPSRNVHVSFFVKRAGCVRCMCVWCVCVRVGRSGRFFIEGGGMVLVSGKEKKGEGRGGKEAVRLVAPAREPSVD